MHHPFPDAAAVVIQQRLIAPRMVLGMDRHPELHVLRQQTLPFFEGAPIQKPCFSGQKRAYGRRERRVGGRRIAYEGHTRGHRVVSGLHPFQRGAHERTCSGA